MNKEDLLNIFTTTTNGKKYIEAKKVIENDLISSYDVYKDDSDICIEADVISDSLMSTYLAKIILDTSEGKIIKTRCSCEEFEKFELLKKNYCCKHLIATFYYCIDDICNITKHKEEPRTVSKYKLIDTLVDDKKTEFIKLKVFLEKDQWSNGLKMFFKVSVNDKFYILKDLYQFLIHYNNNIPLRISNDISIFTKNQSIYPADESIMNFIELIQNINKADAKFIDGKYIIIPEYLVHTMFEYISNNKVYLYKGFYFREIEANIIKGNPKIDMFIEGASSGYKLGLKSELPISMTSFNNVFRVANNIYIADTRFAREIHKFLPLFKNNTPVNFDFEDEEKIIKELIPKLNNICDSLYLNKFIKDKIIDCNPTFKFMLDMVSDKLTLKIIAIYGDLEINILDYNTKKYVFRRKKLEAKILSLISRLGFEKSQKSRLFLLKGTEEDIFYFFKNEILLLHKEGEVFYSSKVKGIKILKTNNIKIDISAAKENYFEFSYKIDGLEHSDLLNIIEGFENNKKYYKLKNGEYLDLENKKLKDLAKLINITSSNIEESDSKFRVSTVKSILVDDILKNIGIENCNGMDNLQKFKKTINDVYSKNYKKPKTFKGILRAYQEEGVKWFDFIKKISHGGILADDMGLGKTIQTLAFLSGEYDIDSNIKVLIVAPTSLLYNWQAEISKFTELECEIVQGVKGARRNVISDFRTSESNILITTYGTLKNDLELYNDIIFDYVILDEAQIIKNSKSIITKSVKCLKAHNKFALTGTPIENSLNELWSIFDFVMPGYLKNEENFNFRYNRNLNEGNEILSELRILTSKFILRRTKKEVLEELPDKITKDILIPLRKENKKVYGIYNENIKSFLETGRGLNGDKNDRFEILAYITKLRQICLDPNTVISDYNGNTDKIDMFLEILNEKLDNGHKILVFSQFASVLKNISNRLVSNNINFSYLDGSLNVNQRKIEIDKLKKGINNVFLISTKSGGVGLNLTEADIVIHFDPWWNPAVENQATDRAYRIGQQNNVEVLRLIAKDTIEEKIIKLQERKVALFNSVLDFENSYKNIQMEDIIEIIRQR